MKRLEDIHFKSSLFDRFRISVAKINVRFLILCQLPLILLSRTIEENEIIAPYLGEGSFDHCVFDI